MSIFGKRISGVFSIIIIAYCCYYIVSVFIQQISFIDYRYQHEYREGALMPAVDILTEGNNPYEIRYQPQHDYMYGILFPVISLPFVEIFGNELPVYRWINFTFMILCCALTFITIRKNGSDSALAMMFSVTLYSVMNTSGMIASARPEAAGMFFYMLALLIPYIKKFSYNSLTLSIITGIAAFFLKPYYILPLPMIALYLFLFVSKKKSLVYFAMAFVLFVLISLIADMILPSYFNNVLFANSNVTVYLPEQVMVQMKQYVSRNIIIILAMAIVMLVLAGKKIRSRKSSTIQNLKASRFMLSMKEPLVKTVNDYFYVYVCMVTLIIFIVKLGGHTGSSHAAYLYHLTSPFLILLLSALIRKADDKAVNFAVILMLIFTINRQFRLQKHDLDLNKECFSKIEDIVKSNKTILNSPEIVSVIVMNDKENYNSGHSEYYKPGVGPLSISLGMSDEVASRQKQYDDDLRALLDQKYFDVVFMTNKNHSMLVDSAALARNYICTDTLCASMFYKSWKVEVWYPRRNEIKKEITSGYDITCDPVDRVYATKSECDVYLLSEDIQNRRHAGFTVPRKSPYDRSSDEYRFCTER